MEYHEPAAQWDIFGMPDFEKLLWKICSKKGILKH